jgi:Kelch motif protein
MRWLLACALAALTGCTVDGGPVDCPSKQRPTARAGVGAVLVPATNQIYALGGATATGPVDELWRYSFGACGGWYRLTTASSPGPRAHYAAAFDTKRERILYIGGANTNDVWALDTNKLTFSKLVAVGNPPTVAASEVAAYDAEHDRVIVAGIATYALEFGSSDQGLWTFIDASSLQSPASGAADPTRSLLLARDAAGLHAFAFLTGTWHDVAMQGDVPPVGAGLVWDDNDKQFLTVGDTIATAQLDAGATTAVFTTLPTTPDATGSPTARTDAAIAVSGELLWMSGGATASGCVLDDLWQLDLASSTWKNVWPATTCL